MTGLTIAFRSMGICLTCWTGTVRAGSPGPSGHLYRRRRGHAPANILSPGFLHLDGVLENSGRGKLIHHFTVFLAAQSSIMQVPVRRNRAEAFVDEVDGNIQSGVVKGLHKQ